MHCSRARRIVAHAATTGALLVCLAVIAGFGRTDKLTPAEQRSMAAPNRPPWTTSSLEPATPPPAAVAAVEAPPTVVADLPPPIVVNDVGPAAAPLADAPLAEPEADVVGLWAPDASSCSLRSFRQGLLPTIINTEGAWAGETFCVFKSRKPTESGWRVVAECSSGNDHWTTQVRLSLKGQRLIWDSKRGRQVYTRCGTDLRMAAAP
jgi:hypothetical protein